MIKQKKADYIYVFVVKATNEKTNVSRIIGVFGTDKLATRLCNRRNKNFHDLKELYTWHEVRLFTDVPNHVLCAKNGYLHNIISG